MKFLLLAIIALIGAVALSLGVLKDPGYILLGYGEWSVETSLALFVVALFVLFFVIYFMLRSVAGIRRLPGRTRHWNQQRRVLRSRRLLNEGLIALAEGHWQDAEKKLLKNAGDSDSPLLGYIAAARAAQQQGAHERRDEYLRLAHSGMPEADIAVGLTQAELQISHQQMEQALATLTRLRELAPRHVHVLEMLAKLYRSLGDWNRLHELLPELRKRKALVPEEIDRIEAETVGELMRQAAADKDLDRVRGLWNHLPRRLKRDEQLQVLHINQLDALGATGEAEDLVRSSIRSEWNDRLVYFFGRLHGGDPKRQLSLVEGWLKEHDQNPVLLLTAGRIAMRNKLWGKARTYLDASIGIAPTMESYQVLGALLEQMGEGDEAMGCYRQAMRLVSDQNALSLPDASDEAAAEVSEAGEESADCKEDGDGEAERR